MTSILRTRSAIEVIDASDIAWRDSGKQGIRLKTVREDASRGLFLGQVAFEPMTRSGLHQHQDVATSFFVSGSLTDYSGSARPREVGINFRGSTHDAISYDGALLVARLEGPVIYPPEGGALHGLHAGSRHGQVVNEAPEQPPEVNVAVEALDWMDTGVIGCRRRTVFDYAGTGKESRMLQWSIRPGTSTPRFACDAPLEFWVYGGDLQVEERAAHADCFGIIAPCTEVTFSSRFGALLFVWTERAPTPCDTFSVSALFDYA